MAGKKNKLDGNQIEFVKQLEHGLLCNICKFILQSPFQTKMCGHRFCKKCINELITSGSKMCPVDNTVLSKEQIFPDRFCNRQIMALKCFCSSKDRGCNWTGAVKELLEDHQSKCPKQLLSCPKGCQAIVPRSEMENHLASCPMAGQCDFQNDVITTY